MLAMGRAALVASLCAGSCWAFLPTTLPSGRSALPAPHTAIKQTCGVRSAQQPVAWCLQSSRADNVGDSFSSASQKASAQGARVQNKTAKAADRLGNVYSEAAADASTSGERAFNKTVKAADRLGDVYSTTAVDVSSSRERATNKTAKAADRLGDVYSETAADASSSGERAFNETIKVGREVAKTAQSALNETVSAFRGAAGDAADEAEDAWDSWGKGAQAAGKGVAPPPQVSFGVRAAGAKTFDPDSSSKRGQLKAQLLQLAASTDRGQLLNEGVARTYPGKRIKALALVKQLSALLPINSTVDPADLDGEWELVFSTAQLFRSSPFFQMIEAANKQDPSRAETFFRLHELQTRSWGASQIAGVRQTFDFYLGRQESAVDLILLPLTSIPLVGFFKLLPTFGGSVVTEAYASLTGTYNETIQLTVDVTKFRPIKNVPLLPGAGQLLKNREFPTAEAVKRVLGRVPIVEATIKYLDEDFRIMQGPSGEIFVYTRLVSSSITQT